jgi:hypothetical protein
MIKLKQKNKLIMSYEVYSGKENQAEVFALQYKCHFVTNGINGIHYYDDIEL